MAVLVRVLQTNDQQDINVCVRNWFGQRGGRRGQNLGGGRTGWGPRGELMSQLHASAVGWQGSLFFGKQVFFLRPSTDWARLTHVVEGNLLYLRSSDLNVSLT